MQLYLSVLAFVLLVALAAGRALMLRKRGVNAFVFGVTDKSDFFLMPIVALFFYSILAGAFGLPIPKALKTHLFESELASWIGITICCASIIWIAITLKSFGDSFRIGIDETAPDKLVTSGVFAFSRNPIYLAFIAFITGMLLVYPNPVTVLVLILFAAAIHRQVLREEKFLRSHYGREYEEYCRRVRRYL
jgi:protein-S-isoprenylcysteine O-methyltransferase Ste14